MILIAVLLLLVAGRIACGVLYDKVRFALALIWVVVLIPVLQPVAIS